MGAREDDWIRNASDAEDWFTFAFSLQEAALVTLSRTEASFHETLAVLPPNPFPSPDVMILPGVNIDAIIGHAHLAPGYPVRKIFVLHNIHYLLAGYAFENLAKAVRIAQEGRDAILKLLAEWKKKGHDLVRLVEKVGIKLEPQQREVLSLLSRFVLHLGRYPTPLTMNDSRSYKFPDNHGDIMQEIWDKLIEQFKKERKNGKAHSAKSSQDSKSDPSQS